MRHALSVALQGFAGAMVIVSHDRHLLKTVTDELIIVHDRKAEEFDGDLDDYAVFINQSKLIAKNSNTNLDEETSSANQVEVNLSKKEQRQQDANRRKQLQPLMNKLKKSEQRLDELTTKKETLEKQLADPDIYLEEKKENLKKVLFDKTKIDKELNQVEAEWMTISEELESASVLID